MSFDPVKYSKVYNQFEIQLKFEFFSYYGVDKTVQILKDHLNKEIIKDNEDNIICDDYTYKLKFNNAFLNPYVQLITGNLDYQTARLTIIKVFEKIREFGYTDPKTFLRVKLSVAEGSQLIPDVSNIDRLRYILNFDESLIWSKFELQKDSPFVRSMYHIVPVNKIVDNIKTIDSTRYKLPNSNLYGIDYTGILTNQIGFNYIGGEKYEKKINEALDCVDYYMISLASTLNSNEYTEKNRIKLELILDDLRDVLIGYESPMKFKKEFPELKLTVDLNDNEQVLKTHWPKIKDKIFCILVNSNLKTGSINYDTFLSRMQIKDAKFKSLNLRDIEVVDSEIYDSVLNKCNLYKCTVINSNIEVNNIYANTEIKNSKLKNSYCNSTVDIFDCYVNGKETIFNGTMNGGIFREGNISDSASLKSNVKVVEYTKIKPTKLKVY